MQGLAALLTLHRVDFDHVLCQWAEATENHRGLSSINKHLKERGQRVRVKEVKLNVSFLGSVRMLSLNEVLLQIDLVFLHMHAFLVEYTFFAASVVSRKQRRNS